MPVETPPQSPTGGASGTESMMDEETKECFGEKCKGCKDFYGCTEHFPYGCWGEE